MKQRITDAYGGGGARETQAAWHTPADENTDPEEFLRGGLPVSESNDRDSAPQEGEPAFIPTWE